MERYLKLDITSLDLCIQIVYTLWERRPEISRLETEIPKMYKRGTNTMSVFRKCGSTSHNPVILMAMLQNFIMYKIA